MDPSPRLDILLSHGSYMQTQLIPLMPWCTRTDDWPTPMGNFPSSQEFLSCMHWRNCITLHPARLLMSWMKNLCSNKFSKKKVFSLSRGTPSTTWDQCLALVWAWYKSTIKVNLSNISHHAYPKLKPWTLGGASFGCASSEPSRMIILFLLIGEVNPWGTQLEDLY